MLHNNFDCAPTTDNPFRKCRGIKYMSRLDLASRFWQLEPNKDNSKMHWIYIQN